MTLHNLLQVMVIGSEKSEKNKLKNSSGKISLWRLDFAAAE